MLDFWNLYQDVELERLIAEGVEDHQPADARWDRPLSDSDSGNVYRFNVSGDDCGTESRPCYQVNVSGTPANGVSISFSRNGSYSDEHRGVGMEVFKGVLKGLSEYVQTLKPSRLSWSAVTKSVPNPHTGKIVNPEARAHVYEAWALRYLFPDKYIGMSGQWLRRDIYDSEYVPNGYPPVPEGLDGSSSSTAKRKALEEMQEKAQQNRDEIHRREREREEAEQRRREQERQAREAEARRQREEAEARRQEFMNRALEDESQNPNGIKKDDIVYILDPGADDWGFENRLGQVEGFQFGSYRYGGSDESEPVHAIVQFADDEEATGDNGFHGRRGYIALPRLKKESPEGRADRERRKRERVEAALSNPEKNPHGIRQGDEIISWMPESLGSTQNGLLGKVREIEVDRYNTVTAKIDWTPEATQALQSDRYGRDVSQLSVGVANLRKATPEMVAEIKRKMREHEIEQRVVSGRERWQSRTRSAEEPASSQGAEATEDLTNHPANPLHLKVGDLVKLRNPPRWGRQARRSHFNGVLVRLEKNYWQDDGLTGYIKFHGSNAEPFRVWNVANEIDRDDSEESRSVIARQQTRQQRAQRIASSTGGHQIGDTVTVVNGRHRGKSGRIVNFRSSGGGMSAVIIPLDGDDFSVNVNMLQPPASTPPPAAESFSFRDYLMYFESRINRGLAS